MITAKHSYSESEKVENEVAKLTSTVDILTKVASSVSVGGIAMGALLSIATGPAAFVTGAVLSLLSGYLVKNYAVTKKKEINQELVNLKSKDVISGEEVAKLKQEIDLIYSDSPK